MKKKVLIPILIILITLGMIYAVGLLIFNNRFLPNTKLTIVDAKGYINEKDVDVGFDKTDDIFKDIKERYGEKILSIKVNDNISISCKLKEIQNADVAKTEEGRVVKQITPVYSWPLEVFKKHGIIYKIVLESEKTEINRIVDEALADYEGTAPGNASIEINDEGEFYIKEGEKGTQIDSDALKIVLNRELGEALITDEGVEIDLSGEDFYTKAEKTEDDPKLVAQTERLNKIVSREIILDMVDAKETIQGGDYIDTEKLLTTGEIIIDEPALDEFVEYLCRTYNTYETERDFKTHDGNWIKVGGNGGEPDTYGFTLAWQDTWDTIYEALTNTNITEIEAIWLMEGNARDENGDIGDTYIEISLAEQHLWYWIDGELFLDTPVVTGLPTAERATPPGVYGIYSKGTDVTLTGQMGADVWNSHVNYWMSVTYSEIGLHDAPWRGNNLNSFGGNIYSYNGSHGCINLSYEPMSILYDNTPMNTCVIIY